MQRHKMDLKQKHDVGDNPAPIKLVTIKYDLAQADITFAFMIASSDVEMKAQCGYTVFV